MASSPLSDATGTMATGPNRGRRLALIIPASLITILVGSLMFAACAPLYVPNPVHVPMMNHSGEAQAAAYIGTSTYSANVDFSLIDHLILLGSYSFEPRGVPDQLKKDSTAMHLGHTFWETGLGWYGNINTEKLELLAGYGAGSASAFWPTDSNSDGNSFSGWNFFEDRHIYRLDGDFRRVFVQANLGSRLHNTAGRDTAGVYGAVLRATYVWYTEVRREGRSTMYPHTYSIEPVIFFRGGWSFLQLEMQAGISMKIPANDYQTRTQSIFFNIGARGVLDGLW